MYKGKKILAIVPAELSSKRLKQKNIIKVSRGKILINWTYEAIKILNILTAQYYLQKVKKDKKFSY